VAGALREALRWQNGLHPSATRNFFYALSRFGIREDSLLEALKSAATKDSLEVLLHNREALWHEPQVAAAAYGLASVLDRAAYGTLPPLACDEALLYQLALLACAVAHDPSLFPDFRKELASLWHEQNEANRLSSALAKSFAMGWRAKWKSR
jgi:hypothetical protein